MVAEAIAQMTPTGLIEQRGVGRFCNLFQYHDRLIRYRMLAYCGFDTASRFPYVALHRTGCVACKPNLFRRELDSCPVQRTLQPRPMQL